MWYNEKVPTTLKRLSFTVFCHECFKKILQETQICDFQYSYSWFFPDSLDIQFQKDYWPMYDLNVFFSLDFLWLGQKENNKAPTPPSPVWKETQISRHP